jgi:hypothetical protein
MIFDYHFGFMRRGLFGAALELLAPPPYHYLTLARIAFAVCALWLALLACAGWRLVRTDSGIAAAMVLFFLSAGFASLIDDMGYLEHVGLILVLICLFLPATWQGLATRSLLIVAAVLVHEANLLMLVPVIGFDCWAAANAAGWRRPILLTLAVLLPAILFTWYFGAPGLSCDATHALVYYSAKARDFVVRSDAIDALCGSSLRLFGLVQMAWISGVRFVDFFLALSVILPSTLFNLCLSGRILRRSLTGFVAATLAAFSPLVLIIVAADLIRFVSLIQVTSLLVLISSARRMGLPGGGALPPLLRGPACLTALAALELGSSLVLTHGAPMLKFPFVPLAIRTAQIILERAPFVVIPNY